MLGKHLLGLYEKALPPEMSWRERLLTARELGYDYVEISVDEKDERLARLEKDNAERIELHAALRETGMHIPSMCLSGHRRFPFGSADPAIRRRAADIMEKAIAFSVELGIRNIQLAGYDVYYEPSTEESLRLFREGLAWACELAEKHQVMLSMEIMDTPLMSSISRYKEYKAELSTPWFNVYPDLGNLTAWGNDVPSELALGGKEIVAVHVKETLAVTTDFPGQFKCVPFGTGCVDFAGDFGILEKQGFRGPYMMEMWYAPGQDYHEEIAKAKRFIETEFVKGTEG